jgi:hypothetical protein
MCVGREHFNLCKCGCPESLHEEDFAAQIVAEVSGGFYSGRGKCHGEISLNLSIEEIRKLIDEAKERGDVRPALTKPCGCKKFDPLFKPMCTGFGA